jgi:sulfur carrier protein
VLVWINGEQRVLAEGASILDAARRFGFDRNGIAVAVEGEVVRRAAWPSIVLDESLWVEVLAAVQGG